MYCKGDANSWLWQQTCACGSWQPSSSKTDRRKICSTNELEGIWKSDQARTQVRSSKAKTWRASSCCKSSASDSAHDHPSVKEGFYGRAAKTGRSSSTVGPSRSWLVDLGKEVMLRQVSRSRCSCKGSLLPSFTGGCALTLSELNGLPRSVSQQRMYPG